VYELTRRYFHVRVRNPKSFKKNGLKWTNEDGELRDRTFVTIDVGEREHMKLVIGKLKGKDNTATQKYLLLREDFKETKNGLKAITKRGKRELESIKQNGYKIIRKGEDFQAIPIKKK